MPTHIHMGELPAIVAADLGNSFPKEVDSTTPAQRLRVMLGHLNEMYITLGQPETVSPWQVEAMGASLRNYLTMSRMYKGHVVKPNSRLCGNVSLHGEWATAWVMQVWQGSHRALRGTWGPAQDPAVPEFEVHDS